MDAEASLRLLVDLHRGLERLGPGSRACTLRALSLCEGLPSAPRVLDAGCGSGASALVLAEATGGELTAVDLHPELLDALRDRAQALGLGARIRTLAADLAALPFPAGSFDLIWSEGAIYTVGFDLGLAALRPLLAPGGWLAVTDLSWFHEEPPAEAREWWAAEYPAMRSVTENLAAARRLGFEPGGHFALPAAAWTEGYYGPLEARLEPFLAAHPGDPAAAAVVEATRQEIALYRRHSSSYGYEFFVLRARAGNG